ncbi:hypothetical protein FA13DRAFT_1053347 [Coprinellus micaceus]|uniref:BTB domain-containing protein n=1 Tax=Coprinellus micaceus TaxID=71717 RepID=A0A4Y7SYP3_COPMI|nr:hypothetical protein FA13DRAFT_1053347 [Coprinellus micaceus]
MTKGTKTKVTTANDTHGGPKFPPQTSCSQRYYIDGGDLWVIIDTTYIRVHSSFFVKGTSFFTSFLDPSQKLDQNALPGTGRPENAIIIRIASIKEFERFCWVFYNEKIDDYSEATIEEWFTILRLAHTWGFNAVKAMALRYIKKNEDQIPNVVDRIVKYEQYAPPTEMLLPLYVELCKRDEYPTDEECDKLGDTRALKIHRAREKLLRAGKKAGGKLDVAQFKAIVAETLGLKDGLTSVSAPGNGSQAPSTSTLSTDKTSTKADGADESVSGFKYGGPFTPQSIWGLGKSQGT